VPKDWTRWRASRALAWSVGDERHETACLRRRPNASKAPNRRGRRRCGGSLQGVFQWRTISLAGLPYSTSDHRAIPMEFKFLGNKSKLLLQPHHRPRHSPYALGQFLVVIALVSTVLVAAYVLPVRTTFRRSFVVGIRPNSVERQPLPLPDSVEASGPQTMIELLRNGSPDFPIGFAAS
jgi:hypothetical protein